MNQRQNLRFSAGGLLLLIAYLLGLPALCPLDAWIRVNAAPFLVIQCQLPVVLVSALVAMTKYLTTLPLLILAILLLAKHRGGGMVILTGLLSVLGLVGLILNPGLTGILYVLAFAMMLFLPLAAREPSLSWMKKLWFLPGSLLILESVILFVQALLPGYTAPVSPFTSLDALFSINETAVSPFSAIAHSLVGMLGAVGLFLACHWIVNPYKTLPPTVQGAYTPAVPAQPTCQPPVPPAAPVMPQAQPVRHNYQAPVPPQPPVYQAPPAQPAPIAEPAPIPEPALAPAPAPEPIPTAVPGVPADPSDPVEINKAMVRYKALLDSGAITLDEYRAMRKYLRELKNKEE